MLTIGKKIKAFAIITLMGVSFLSADILPDRVLIVANANVPGSIELAKFYANERAIPSRNIIVVKTSAKELVSRGTFERTIRKPIRQFLKISRLEDKIDVIVTVYGMPLKIADKKPTQSQRRLAHLIKQRYYKTFAMLEEYLRLLEKLAGVKTQTPTTLPSRDNIETFGKYLPQNINKIRKLYKIIAQKIEKTKDKAEKYMLIKTFINLRVQLNGVAGLIGITNKRSEKFNELKIQAEELERRYWAEVMKEFDKRDFQVSCTIANKLGGVILELRTLYEDYMRVMERESRSAVDSELSLVLWDWYPLAGKMLNVLNPRFTNHPIAKIFPRVIMVSRLDGPSVNIVRRVILDSIEAEKTGLLGAVAIDARGIKSDNGLLAYDRDLRKLALFVREKTNLKVIFDDKPALFELGSCKDVAFYCGWYSLRRYISAFKFVRGSVGFHIASFEAETLRDNTRNTWCKGLLKDGICATLGPTYEPYLDAFPLPSEFFGLILTGRYSIVEVFYRTSRYNSWQMILIADPMYNPFKLHPQIDEGQVELARLGFRLYR